MGHTKKMMRDGVGYQALRVMVHREVPPVLWVLKYPGYGYGYPYPYFLRPMSLTGTLRVLTWYSCMRLESTRVSGYPGTGSRISGYPDIRIPGWPPDSTELAIAG